MSSKRDSSSSASSEVSNHETTPTWDFDDSGSAAPANLSLAPPQLSYGGSSADNAQQSTAPSKSVHRMSATGSSTDPKLLRTSANGMGYIGSASAGKRRTFQQSSSSSSLNVLGTATQNSTLIGPRPMSMAPSTTAHLNSQPATRGRSSFVVDTEASGVTFKNPTNSTAASSRERSLRRRHNDIFGATRNGAAHRREHTVANDPFGGTFSHGDADEVNGNCFSNHINHVKNNWWTVTAKTATCCIPRVVLQKLGKMEDDAVQQAWREKVTLCLIAACMWAALAFLTFAFTLTVCPSTANNNQYDFTDLSGNLLGNQLVAIHGKVYSMANFWNTHNDAVSGSSLSGQSGTIQDAIKNNYGADFSAYFPSPYLSSDSCKAVSPDGGAISLPCKGSLTSLSFCHPTSDSSFSDSLSSAYMGELIFEWSDIQSNAEDYTVYNGKAIRISQFLNATPPVLSEEALELLRASQGRDATLLLVNSALGKKLGDCLSNAAVAGETSKKSVGCFASDVFLYVSFAIIVGVVVIRFILAFWFYWTMSKTLGSLKFKASKGGKNGKRVAAHRRNRSNSSTNNFKTRTGGFLDGDTSTSNTPVLGHHLKQSSLSSSMVSTNSTVAASSVDFDDRDRPYETPNLGRSRVASNNALSWNGNSNADLSNEVSQRLEDLRNVLEEPYTIIMVPCYSEGREALKTTLDSLARTTYSDSKKLIAVVADGLVKGSGNAKSTPEVLIDMIDLDKALPQVPAKLSYIAVASGSRRHNKAQVYVGQYHSGSHSVPILLVVKCGTDEEASAPKPGNRGKRDSQLILMGFFQKILFDERLSPMEYDMFTKIRYLMGVNADEFEVCLMVDADTVVAPDSLSRMVACMVNDPHIIGLCGETRISNKRTSFTTRIQVFEYYINHHLNKAFESIFGGVTCLPGCFCMYRIKTPKEDGFWVPILASPDIVTPYSADKVDTLHQKNLLLLGEDRFLTTLMLKTFPRRKLVFVPRAYCKTQVPDSFKVLLSQRRRWINSTVHNLLELVLVRELCGTFCFSMQFVLLMELIGSAMLPAAICFTILLIILSIVRPPVQILPLILLFVILGLPAFLIALTTRKLIYVYWMFIYLIGLPIWNFVLPVYSFWHFDDFSWGQTRKVAGEKNGGDKHGHGSSKDDVPVTLQITHKRWAEWEFERRRKIYDNYVSNVSGSSTLSEYSQGLSTSSDTEQFSRKSFESRKEVYSNGEGYTVSDSADDESAPEPPSKSLTKYDQPNPTKVSLHESQTPSLTLLDALPDERLPVMSDDESLMESVLSVFSKEKSPPLSDK